jgi:molybdopterin molybdotransferase
VITFDEAAALITRVATPVGTEKVPLSEARGRVLAAAVHAELPCPAADVSAMDGYAVRETDLAVLPAVLPVAGGAFAGTPFDGRLPDGACLRIFTGAPLPAGADRVIMQEDVRRTGAFARFEQPLSRRPHVRAAGSDFEAGDLLVPAGVRLKPQRLVAAAAANLAAVDVYRRPRVAILATGDELAAPGARPVSGAVPESVSFGVAALAEDWGATVVSRRRCRDDLPRLQRAAAAAVGEADLVVVTGGASVGEKDFAREMFAPLGLELIFNKVAIRPGKPVWMGRVGETFIVGLPGNPTSAMVTARLLLAPLLAGLSGGDPREAWSWRALPLNRPMEAEGERETFHRAGLERCGATVSIDQDSSAQRALTGADLLIRRRPRAPAIQAGDLVEVLDL